MRIGEFATRSGVPVPALRPLASVPTATVAR